MDENGNQIYVDDNGKLIDEHGNSILTPLRNSDGIAINTGIERGLGKLVSESGNPILYKGQEVFVDEQGRLLGADGSILVDSDGNPLRLNANGEIVDAYGRKVAIAGGMVIGEADASNTTFSTRKRALLPSGEPMTIDGRPVYKNADGLLVYEDGTPVKDKNGNDVYLEGNEFVTENGLKISPNDIGEIATESTEIVLGKNGKPLMYNGRKVYKRADGTLVDEFGNVIKGEDGKPLAMNAAGEIVDSSGRKASMKGFTVDGKQAINEGFQTKPVTATEIVLGKNGKPLMYNGRKVYKRADGTLVDEFGNVIKGEDGKPLAMNAAGEIVDSSGRKASMKGFTVDGKQAINEGFQTKPVTATEIVLGKNGKPLMYNGSKVYKRADGTLVDEFGNVIKGEDGKPLAMNAAGETVDSSGRKASMKGFTEDGKPLLSGDLKTKYVSELNELGKSGIHVTEDGLLVDKDGKAITIDNKKVIRGADGQLFDEYGRPILDENGQPVYMDEEGNIVNAQGEPVKNILLQDGTGKIIGSGDNENIRQIGDSDLFANKDGFLLGVDGKPILFDGKAVTVGKNGRLYTVDGKPVVDANGNAVYVGANGELRTKNGDLSKGVLLTNSDGVLLDSKGELVTAGGKLTKLEGTDFYRTQDGMLVTKDGKVVSLSGERLFISDDGLLQNAYLRPIRFRGKSLSIGKNGDLYDEQGRKVVDENNSPITLTENGLSSELGVLLEQNNTPKRNLSLPPAEEVVDLISSIEENETEIEE